jgi:hypothetical protein
MHKVSFFLSHKLILYTTLLYGFLYHHQFSLNKCLPKLSLPSLHFLKLTEEDAHELHDCIKRALKASFQQTQSLLSHASIFITRIIIVF